MKYFYETEIQFQHHPEMAADFWTVCQGGSTDEKDDLNDAEKNQPPAFKAKVAADSIRGELTLAELSKNSDVYTIPIPRWK